MHLVRPSMHLDSPPFALRMFTPVTFFFFYPPRTQASCLACPLYCVFVFGTVSPPSHLSPLLQKVALGDYPLPCSFELIAFGQGESLRLWFRVFHSLLFVQLFVLYFFGKSPDLTSWAVILNGPTPSLSQKWSVPSLLLFHKTKNRRVAMSRVFFRTFLASPIPGGHVLRGLDGVVRSHADAR